MSPSKGLIVFTGQHEDQQKDVKVTQIVTIYQKIPGVLKYKNVLLSPSHLCRARFANISEECL